ncbi:glycosyltransferase [Janthinobacterium sp. GW460P]|uniref:glycosyltransferase n=1 Tax=unclassified Janthinobacterium TaxID=2610881 RepID=UPI000A325034|nr:MULTISPECIES: glycosyltransferase [unclassified Janthinobacterium]MCC7701298.1 glycosyltransferase [Janthinobacterium sp. GW460P]MCC7706805.1 glycosyltransferase [Janthinobacterium sp. GW460W]
MDAQANATVTVPDRVRLLQLVPEPLPTFRADVAVLFGRYLPRLGIDCDLVGKPGGVGNDEVTAFSSVRTGGARGGRVRRELSYLAHYLGALLTAKRVQCDVIQVRDMVSIGVLGLLIARCKGIPFVYWVSFLMCEARIARARAQLTAHGGLRNRLVLLKGLLEERILYHVVLPHAQHVFVQSDAMLQIMLKKGIRKERLSAVPMGVDTQAVSGMQVEARRPADWHDGPLIAYLGTLDASRQIERMIDALAIIRLQIPAARLLLIGASALPADTERLLAHASSLGLADAVRITGWLPSQEAWTLLASADAAVSYFPRGLVHDVCSPTKLMEYLALAMPVVANDNPDQVRVLQDSNAGWLVESSTDAMAEGLLCILRDIPAAKERAAAGPAYIESQRSYRVIANDVAKDYRKLTAS